MNDYQKPINCIICNKEIYPLIDDTYDMVDGGIVAKIEAPFGSCFDGNIYQIGICDECVEKNKLKQIDRI